MAWTKTSTDSWDIRLSSILWATVYYSPHKKQWFGRINDTHPTPGGPWRTGKEAKATTERAISALIARSLYKLEFGS